MGDRGRLRDARGPPLPPLTRAGNRGGDVHIVGGPRTIEAFRALGALDALELVVLPLVLGDGMRLTPSIAADAGLTFVRERALPGGAA